MWAKAVDGNGIPSTQLVGLLVGSTIMCEMTHQLSFLNYSTSQALHPRKEIQKRCESAQKEKAKSQKSRVY